MSFLVKLKIITVLENIRLSPSQSHYSIRKLYFSPKQNILWEYTLRKCLSSRKQSNVDLRLLVFDPEQHRSVVVQRSRVNSLVLCSVLL